MTTANRTALWGSIAAVFITWVGVGTIIPVLPLFIKDRGASYSLLGAIVAASLVGHVVGQYPAGRLSDRLGRRPLMLGGLLLQAAAVAAFLLPMPVPLLIGVRFLIGLGGAAFLPVSRALVADLVPPARRGMAYGWLSGAEMAGLVFGPALGGLLALLGLAAVFEATAGALVLGAVVLAWALRRGEPVRGSASPGFGWAPMGSRRALLAMLGIGALTVGPNYLHGMYEVVWSLFMRGIGASSLQIGASFSLFALPYVLLVPLAGWAADRYDRRWLAAASTAGAGLIAAVYPFLPSIPLVIAFCALEGAVVVFGIPAKNAFLMDAVPADRRGQVQGVIGAGSGLGAALAAVVAGPQFEVAVPLAFFFAAVVDLVLVLVALPLLAAAGEAERVPA